MLRISGNHQKLEEMQGIDIASGFPEGTNPDNTLILEFLASRTVREYFCYEGPRKLIQTIMDTWRETIGSAGREEYMCVHAHVSV